MANVPVDYYKKMMGEKRHRCCVCGYLTYKWQKINGGAYHCYDNCKSTLENRSE